MNSIAFTVTFLVIVGAVSIANLAMAYIDFRKTKVFRLVFIPEEAHTMDIISTLLMVAVVIVFVLDIAKLIRPYTGFYALFLWVLYDNFLSMYFRARKWSEKHL